MRELLIGCGHSREKRMSVDGNKEWDELVTLDMLDNVGADIVHNLDVFPYPLGGIGYDAIHAYEVLEHCGWQGDSNFFFRQFSEFHRVLIPFGELYITVPHHSSVWALGDPGHKRIITREQLCFLDKSIIAANREQGTPMTDYSHIWKRDFRIVYASHNEHTAAFVLRKYPCE